jgi:hypothetical protein
MLMPFNDGPLVITATECDLWLTVTIIDPVMPPLIERLRRFAVAWPVTEPD